MVSILQVLRPDRNKRLINDKGPSLVDFIDESRRLINKYPLVWGDNDPINFSVNPNECTLWRTYWYRHGRRDLETSLDGKFSYIQFAHKDVTLGLNRDNKRYEFLILGEDWKLYHPNRFPENKKRNTEQLEVISAKDIIDSPEAINMILDDHSIKEYLGNLENRPLDIIRFEAAHSKERCCVGYEPLTKAVKRIAEGKQTILYKWGVEQFTKGAEYIHKIYALVDARERKIVATAYDKKEYGINKE